MKIKDLNNTIINAMIQTGTVIDCKEGYMEVSQQSLSEPTLTISVPSTVVVGVPTTITITASASGSIVLYINQEYIGISEGSATYQYVYTPQDTFTIEAYYTSQYGTVANTAEEVTPSTTIPYAVQSFDSQGVNYNPTFQWWLSDNGYSANANYTTMEEAMNLEELPDGAFDYSTSLTHMDELQYFTNLRVIGKKVFYYADLTSIIIPDGLTSIGEEAFYGCTGLTSITIPNSVISIGISAFAGCRGLTSATISNNLTSIANSMFSGCTGLTSITIPNGVTSIGNFAFKNTGLTSVNVPYGVTSIGEEAFAKCGNMTSVTLPSTLQTISHLVFDECRSLRNITIPNSVTTLGNEVFEQTGLTSITIPSSITSIGQGTFYQCTSLSSVTFAEPLGISNLTTGTFAGCSALTSLTLPSGITAIGDGGVQDCRNLRTVTLPSTLTSIGSTAFYLDSSLTEVWCYAATPPSLGSYAFYSIGSNPTLYVPSESVNAYQSSSWANYFSNILPIQAPVTYACQSIDSSGANYNPALQEYLYDSGIASNSGYTTTTEALNLTSIPDDQFNDQKTGGYDNSGITEMNFEDFTNLASIGWMSFARCTNMTSVTLPSSCSDLGMYAFYNCTALTEIVCYATTPPSLTNSPFQGVVRANVTVKVPSSAVATYQANTEWNRFGTITSI